MVEENSNSLSRRTFLKLSASSAAGAIVASLWPRIQSAQAAAAPGPIESSAGAQPLPTRLLGRTGVPVSLLGLGGEGVLRTYGRMKEAVPVIRRAIEQGITYCDTAPAYSGSQDYYGEALGGDRQRVFLASKTHDRSRDGSLRLLEDSLKRLRTGHLDLWQLHDLRDMAELDEIFGKNGAIHALEQARAEGRVRFFGITGHHDPAVLAEALRRYPFDTALVALNPGDRQRLSFIETLLPAAQQAQAGIIGMKVLARGALADPAGGFGVAKALGYVMSLPITTAIVGFSSPSEVDEAAAYARRFEALSPEEMARLEQLAAPWAEQLTSYKRG